MTTCYRWTFNTYSKLTIWLVLSYDLLEDRHSWYHHQWFLCFFITKNKYNLCCCNRQGCTSQATFWFSTHLDIFCYLLLYRQTATWNLLFNPSSPTSDQDRISPYSISTISSRQEMRIKENINKGIIGWSNSKFSILTSNKLHSRQ